MTDFEYRLQAIEQRNFRVETDKAWETSLTRRLSIVLLTYFTALHFVFAVDQETVDE